jgi:hypothetical protein
MLRVYFTKEPDGGCLGPEDCQEVEGPICDSPDEAFDKGGSWIDMTHPRRQGFELLERERPGSNNSPASFWSACPHWNPSHEKAADEWAHMRDLRRGVDSVTSAADELASRFAQNGPPGKRAVVDVVQKGPPVLAARVVHYLPDAHSVSAFLRLLEKASEGV